MSWRFQRRRYGKDQHEDSIVQALRGAGWSTEPIEGRKGLPDLLATKLGRAVLVEVKKPLRVHGGESGSGRALRESQIRFAEDWHGCPIVVARSGEEAVKLCKEACR